MPWDAIRPMTAIGAKLSASAQTVIDRCFRPTQPYTSSLRKAVHGPKLETNAGNGLQKCLDGTATKQDLNGQPEFGLAFRLVRK
jgi:hypothetical protein